MHTVPIVAERVRVVTVDDAGVPSGHFRVLANQTLGLSVQPGRKFEITWDTDDVVTLALLEMTGRSSLEIWMRVPPRTRTRSWRERFVHWLLRRRDRVHWVFPVVLWCEAGDDEYSELVGFNQKVTHDDMDWGCPDGEPITDWAYWHTTKAPPKVA